MSTTCTQTATHEWYQPQTLSRASKKGGKDFFKSVWPLPSVGSLRFLGEVLHHTHLIELMNSFSCSWDTLNWAAFKSLREAGKSKPRGKRGPETSQNPSQISDEVLLNSPMQMSPSVTAWITHNPLKTTVSVIKQGLWWIWPKAATHTDRPWQWRCDGLWPLTSGPIVAF